MDGQAEDRFEARLRTYRAYSVIAACLLPLFWLAYRYADPAAVDPLWLRLVLAGATLAVLALSYTSPSVRRQFVRLMRVLLFTYTAWFIGLAAANAFSPNYCMGLLFVITVVALAVSTGLRRRRPLLYYLVFAIGGTCAAVALFADPTAGPVGRFIFVGCVVSTALVIYVAAGAAIRAQARLSQSERQYRELFASATDAILILDPEARVVLEVNQKARETYGYHAAAFVGLPLSALAGSPAAVDAWLGPEPVSNLEATHYRQDGTPVELLISTAWIEYGGRPACMSINRDVTERQWAMRMLARTNEALLQRNRELQDFAYVASHDLQEPLRKIGNFADILRTDFADRLGPEGAGYLERMQAAAVRMHHLIRDLLKFSLIASRRQEPVPVDVGAVVADLRAELEPEIDAAGATVEAGPLPTLEADPGQLRQLLRNLIVNALTFRRPGAAPVVRLRAETGTEGEAGRAVCRITVEDNGVGFEMKYAHRLFAPFQRLHGDAYPGTGMGLAICRRIAEQHGGTITAQSTPGQGSTFTVTLPLRQDAAAAAKATTTAGPGEQPPA